jgi:hypothetical protein
LKIFIGMDDTDSLDSDFGTGKVVRWFEKILPQSCECLGVIRQQLLVSDDIPYTSHNSSACMVVEIPTEMYSNGFLKELSGLGEDHLKRHAADGSDPGLCIAGEMDAGLVDLLEFGRLCTHKICTQKDALRAVNGSFLAGLGGTNDGLIGAAAAVGLTASGWAGRYIEYQNLRNFPAIVTVSDLTARQIQVISADRDARIPAPNDQVITNGWVRPLLLGHHPVLFVNPGNDGEWIAIHTKRNKKKPEKAW